MMESPMPGNTGHGGQRAVRTAALTAVLWGWNCVAAATGSPATPPPLAGKAAAEEPALTMALRVTGPVHRAGGTVTVQVVATSPVRLLDAPFQLQFDPEALMYLDGSAGGFLKRGGAKVVFLANAHSRPGTVEVGIGRSDRTRGVEGKGVLCQFRFRVLSSRESVIRIARSSAWSDDGSPLPVRGGSIRLSPIR